jgi:hypothetical protein
MQTCKPLPQKISTKPHPGPCAECGIAKDSIAIWDTFAAKERDQNIYSPIRYKSCMLHREDVGSVFLPKLFRFTDICQHNFAAPKCLGHCGSSATTISAAVALLQLLVRSIKGTAVHHTRRIAFPATRPSGTLSIDAQRLSSRAHMLVDRHGDDHNAGNFSIGPYTMEDLEVLIIYRCLVPV